MKKYRLLFNNDGGFVHRAESATPQGYINAAVDWLRGTQVDAISVSTHNSFNQCQHRTNVGEIYTNANEVHPINHVQTLIDSGRDCLELIVDWAHDNGIDAFWSMRMNDAHDGRLPQIRSQFKRDHSDYFVGREDEAEDIIGDDRWWAAMNYAVPQVRQRALELIEEVALNFDVDGIELDFNRHTIYFPEQLQGSPAEPQHVEMMTDMLRSVRDITHKIGQKRGRSLSLSVRVLDALDLSLYIGLDVRRWLEEKLVDLLIPADYFQFTDLAECIELAHRHGVQVYPCISATRIHGAARLIGSATAEDFLIWRGAAMSIWDSGADGIHIFNGGPTHRSVWSQIGDPAALRKVDKIYTTSCGPRHLIDVWYGPGTRRKYEQFPIDLESDRPTIGVFHVGEDLTSTELKLRIRLQGLDNQNQLVVKLNGQELAYFEQASVPEKYAGEFWLETRPQVESVRCSRNEVEVMIRDRGLAVSLVGVELHVHHRVRV